MGFEQFLIIAIFLLFALILAIVRTGINEVILIIVERMFVLSNRCSNN